MSRWLSKMMTVYYAFATQLDKHIQRQTLARTAKMLLTMAWINIRCCLTFTAFEILSKARWVLAGKCRRSHTCTLGLCKHWSPSLLHGNGSNIHFRLHHWQIFFFLIIFAVLQVYFSIKTQLWGSLWQIFQQHTRGEKRNTLPRLPRADQKRFSFVVTQLNLYRTVNWKNSFRFLLEFL